MLRAALAHAPPGGWIRGSRYDDAKMAEGRVLTRWDLDAISREHPILVLQVAGHWGVVNSKALELGGIDESSEAPPGGKFGRDGSGRLNGILFEAAIFDYAYPQATRRAQTVAPASTPEDRQRGLGLAMRAFHAAGITSLTDAMVGPADIALFQEAQRRGALSMRVNMLLHFEHYELLRSLRPAHRLRRRAPAARRDQGLRGRRDRRPDVPDGAAVRGHERRLRHADAPPTPICATSCGWRTSTATASACTPTATARSASCSTSSKRRTASSPRPDLHHRIEHCSIVNDDILARMKALGAIAAPFGSYVHYHGGKLLDWYGPERIERMFAHRSFLDHGVAVAGSSDYPCGPFQPLLALQSCVTRTGRDGTPLGLSQRITAARGARALHGQRRVRRRARTASRAGSRPGISPTSWCSTTTR